MTTQSNLTHLFVLDGSLQNLQALLSELPAGAVVITLQGDEDGWGQVLHALKGLRDCRVEALHIISHAKAGRVKFGDAWETTQSLSERVGMLTEIGSLLEDDVDVLLYGCSLAADESGRQFVSTLAIAMGVDVAASTNATGPEPLGGNWTLEFEHGQVRARVVELQQLGYTLGAFIGTEGPETLQGTTADDAIYGLAGDDALYGGAGDDWLYGNGGADLILGESGDDTLAGGDGPDTLDGGDGYDRVHFGFNDGSNPGSGIVLNLLGVAWGSSSFSITDAAGQTDIMISVEAVVAEGGPFDDNFVLSPGDDIARAMAGNDILDGGSGNDTLDGGAGDDNLLGGEGDDFVSGGADRDLLLGGPGIETFDGGDGSDTLMLENGDPKSGANVDLQSGTIANDGYGNFETAVNIENIHGTNLGDFIRMSDAKGYVFGRGGDDSIHGGAAGYFIVPGSGSDTIVGGQAIDVINYFDDGYDGGGVSIQGIQADLVAGTVIDNWGFVDKVMDVEQVGGSSLNDYIVGNHQYNELYGNDGNDTLIGHGDAGDSLRGDAGDDSLIGGNGIDNLSGGQGSDTLFGGAGDDRLFGAYGTSPSPSIDDLADFLAGGSGQDVIRGNFGNDTLLGGEDNDNLRGDHGDDWVDGGPGTDFVSYFYGPLDLDAGINFDASNAVGPGPVRMNDHLGGMDTLIDIERIGFSGTVHDDTATGSSGDDQLLAGVRHFEPIFGRSGRVDRYRSRTYERFSGISVVAMC